MRGLAQVSRTIRMVLLPVVCAGIAVAGCSVKAGVTTDSTISKENLEQGISDALTKTVGRKPDAVACPGPVKAKIGETTRCELTGDGVKYGVTATITSNDNGKYQYSVKVDDRPAR